MISLCSQQHCHLEGPDLGNQLNHIVYTNVVHKRPGDMCVCYYPDYEGGFWGRLNVGAVDNRPDALCHSTVLVPVWLNLFSADWCGCSPPPSIINLHPKINLWQTRAASFTLGSCWNVLWHSRRKNGHRLERLPSAVTIALYCAVLLPWKMVILVRF